MLTAILGIVLLVVDKVLPNAPTHYYGLVAFVILDLIVGGIVFAKPTRAAFTTAAAWALIRIIIQLADVSQAQQVGFDNYIQFADYLFNPLSSIAMTLGNPPGVPAILIDLTIILEIIVVAIAWSARSRTPQPNP